MTVRTWTMATPQQTIDALRSAASPVAAERTPLNLAHGRILREPVLADRPSPAADVSAMDGYAVRLEDLASGTLLITGESLPGRAPDPLAPGTTHRIFTGAAVPDGADAVIKREDVEEHPDAIHLPPSLRVQPGAHIRRQGENLEKGAVVVEAGARLDPVRIGALALVGAAECLTSRRIRVAVITTGDEIVDHSPTPWQIRDTNGASLEAFLLADPAVDMIHRTHVRDDVDDLKRTTAAALESADLLLMTGGVSVGDHDHVRDVLESLDVNVLVHGVAQRPGKPVLAGAASNGPLVIALPGNPVSVLVGARRIVTPVLAHLSGRPDPGPDAHVEIADPANKTLHLTWFRLARRHDADRAELVDTRGSGDLTSAARADGFVEVQPHAACAGPLPFYRWMSHA